MTDNKYIKYWLEIAVWMAFIFWMSTATFSAANTSRIIAPIIEFFAPNITDAQFEVIHGIIRKCAHVTEYFILGVLIFRALKNDPAERRLLTTASIALVIVAVFALTDEFHQTFVTSRTPSLIDVSIDTFGGFLAQCVSLVWHHRNRMRRVTAR